MSGTFDILSSLSPALPLVLIRTGGIFLAAPALAEPVVPVRLRVLLAVVLALAAAGRVALPAGPMSDGAFLAAAAGELLVGATIGLAAAVVLSGVEMGAFHISQQMGLSLSQVFDPVTAQGGDPVRRLLVLLAVVVFLAVGGHTMMLSALLGSFESVPVGSVLAAGRATDLIVALLGASFVLGLKVAAPVLAAMLLATVALGLLQKTLPQCNILTVGLPTRALLGLALLGIAAAALGYLVEAATDLVGRHLAAWALQA